MKKNDFRTIFDPPESIGFHFHDESKTMQSFGYETDINNIVKGCISSLPNNYDPPRFGETFKPDAYQEALNIIANAKSNFEELPSHIRKRFNNNPKELLEFIGDEKNLDEAISLGLVQKVVSVSDTSENVVSDVQPVSGASSEASAQ